MAIDVETLRRGLSLILERTMSLALQQMAAQYGTPRCTDESGRRAVRIAALGYGKLGGFELGYGSDLDLVFIHDSTGEQQETDAANPVDNQVFFLRYAQRLIHLLTMHSVAGRLYEVDVRLRPSGKGGMLVTSIEAFRLIHFHRMFPHIGLGFEATLPYDSRLPWSGDGFQDLWIVLHRVENRLDFRWA